MTALISSANRAITQGRPFEIVYNRSGEKVARVLTLFDRFLHWGDDAYERERIGAVAKTYTQALHDLPRLPIAKAASHPVIGAARKFIKKLPMRFLQDRRIQECSREVLAAKLGVAASHFAANPGFEAFAANSRLERYLLHYGHEVKIHTETGQIALMQNGLFIPWPKVQATLAQLQFPTPTHSGNPRQLWCYGPRGVQKKDMYAWNSLEPYKVEKEHEWGDRYIFEFCACCGKTIQMNGDHAWLRLKNPAGEIYCVGLYRPGKNSWRGNFHSPLSVKKGYLMSPDISEFWPTDIYRIAVEITKQQFYTIKGSIESDKKKEMEKAFQLFNGNCTEYVNSKAALAGIQLPTSVHYLSYVTPPSIRRKFSCFINKIPNLVTKIGDLVVTILSNLLQVCLGAHTWDRSLKGKTVAHKPHINAFKDLFDRSKLYFHPPRHLALNVKPEIEKWRKRNDARFALPKKYYA